MEAAEAAEAAAAAAAAAPADALDESEWELVEDGVVLDEASVVEVEENAAGEIDDVVVIEDAVETEAAVEPDAAVDAAPEAEAAAADADEPEAGPAA